jgi:hypothetical protein
MLFVRPQALGDMASLRTELSGDLLLPLLRKYAVHPPWITHYTSVEALEAILSSGKFRMSHFRHLNDSTEMLLGRTVVNKLLEAETRKNDFAAPFFDYCRFAFNEHDDSAIQYFVSSFSALDDSAELWRRYGSEGAGVAIRFDTARLAAHPDEPYTYYVAKVTYSDAEQMQLLEPSVRAAKTALTRYVERFGYDVRDVTIQMFAANLCSMLNHHSISLKDSSWSMEQEWRTVFSVLANDSEERKARIQLRPDGRPYVDVEIRSVAPEGLLMPLLRVSAGSKADASAVREILSELGYGHVEVGRSTVTAVEFNPVAFE